MTIPTEVAAALAEMRTLNVPNWPAGRILGDLADRIESAITKAEAVDSRIPDGYAYVYPTGGGGETIRVGSNGREINGTAPIRAIPYYFNHPKAPAVPVASVPDGWDVLAAFDEAVEKELPRISDLEFNSKSICTHFAKELRFRLSQITTPPTNQEGAAREPDPR